MKPNVNALESVHSLCKLVCCCCFRSLSAQSSRSQSWRRRACDTSAPACVLTGESGWAHPAAKRAATLVVFLLSYAPKTPDASLWDQSMHILTPAPHMHGREPTRRHRRTMSANFGRSWLRTCRRLPPLPLRRRSKPHWFSAAGVSPKAPLQNKNGNN